MLLPLRTSLSFLPPHPFFCLCSPSVLFHLRHRSCLTPLLAASCQCHQSPLSVPMNSARGARALTPSTPPRPSHPRLPRTSLWVTRQTRSPRPPGTGRTTRSLRLLRSNRRRSTVTPPKCLTKRVSSSGGKTRHYTFICRGLLREFAACPRT